MPAAHLCLLSIILFLYIYNCLLIAKSKETLISNINIMLDTLCNLGACVNWGKLNFVLSMHVSFIGAILDTRVFKVFLFQDRAEIIALI